MRRSCLFLSALVLLLINLQSDDWVATSSTGKIIIKNIPESPVIEAEVKDLSESEIQKSFRLASRYLALAKAPIRYPIILIFPDWIPSTETPKPEKIYLQMVLSGYATLPDPKEKGLRLSTLKGGSVLAIARRGNYSSEDWLQDLQLLKTHLKDIDLPASGHPQRMFYHNIDLTPTFWRLSEIQIPIPTLN